MTSSKVVAVIGGGPAGLTAAEVLIQGRAQVDVYDSMSSLGRKFLMAGKRGLNITHSESYQEFVARCGMRQRGIETYLIKFTPGDLRTWVKELGIETFIGTSGRVFRVGMKASPLLRAWLKRLGQGGVDLHTRHLWNGWANDSLLFETPNRKVKIKPDAVVLALGGAWVQWLEQAGVKVEAFRPSNCGFDINWSTHFREKFNGHPVKSVVLSFDDFRQQGEFIVTETGVEGSLIYAASARLRDEVALKGVATLTLDLVPDSPREKLISSLARPRGSRSMAGHLEKTIGLRGVKAGLLHEFLSKEDFADIEKLADAIKELHVQLIGTRSIGEAISSAGGVAFEELDSHLMLRKLPGVFCAGEMLDWETPTGGYLLTACFARGRAAGMGVLDWLV